MHSFLETNELMVVKTNSNRLMDSGVQETKQDSANSPAGEW